jgi:hypothetical protein
VETGEWEDLLARGRESGGLHAEDVTRVLRHVELTGDVLAVVKITMESEGIVIDEAVEAVPDETPRGLRREVVVAEAPVIESEDAILKTGFHNSIPRMVRIAMPVKMIALCPSFSGKI